MVESNFKPCILIPMYNQPGAIEQTIGYIEQLKIPCIIIDDASSAETVEVLDKLLSCFSSLQIVRRKQNGGKGAAVHDGFRAALNQGFSHALQIDADGQHCLEDISRFLECSSNNPDHLIAGSPRYDNSAPMIRIIGRQFSRWLCWLESRSFALSDPLLGFRVYPLKAVAQLLLSHTPAARMDFDLDIAVRLIWQGTPVINIPTQVCYPEDGVSHFDYLRDNRQLAQLHLKLLGLSLLQATGLKRHAGSDTQSSQSTHWSQTRERGSILGLKLLFALYRLIGRRLCAFLLYPVSLYFFLSARRARRASFEFQKMLKSCQSSAKTESELLWSFQHFHEFSIAMVDKVAAWSGQIERSELDFENYQLLSSIRQAGRGVIFLSAHLGNIEVCRAISAMHPDVKINALMFTRHAEKFNRFLSQICGVERLRIVNLEQVNSALMAELEKRLDAGEHVALLADRIPPGSNNKTLSVNFLGSPANFPQGPFLLASLLKRPVYLLFCLRKASGGFRVSVEKFAEEITIPRRSRMQSLQQWIQLFAGRLEHYTLLAPKQWFNFYPFWKQEQVEEEAFSRPEAA